MTPEALARFEHNTTESIVDHLFELHSSVITPRVIARRQIIRLVDRVVTMAKESSPNKENTHKNSGNDRQQRAVSNVLSSAPAGKPELNLHGDKSSDWPTKMLEEAPESERSPSAH